MKQETKFYEFRQNNSGGGYDVDGNVCRIVIVEAHDVNHALEIFRPMIENQSGSCPCCGDRWIGHPHEEIDLSKWREEGYTVGEYNLDVWDDADERWFALYGEFPRIEEPTWKSREIVKEGLKEFVGKIYFNTIEQYCQFVANSGGVTTPDVRIHYLDGTKKEFIKQLDSLYV